MAPFWKFAELGYRQTRRVVIAVVGFTVVLLGLAMLVLPGPGMVVIPVGLAILAIEFAWAARWLSRMKQMAGDAADYAKRRMAPRTTGVEPLDSK